VAAAGVNRAVTGQCWAACRPGLVCDRASGLCVEPGAVSRAPGAKRAASVAGGPVNAAGQEYVVPPEQADAGADAAPDASP
jgi:hypothetical protein